MRIPGDNHRPAGAAKERADRRRHAGLVLQPEAATEAPASRADRDAGDGGDPVVALPAVQDGHLAAWRPGAVHPGNARNTGVVYEDRLGPRLGGLFLGGTAPSGSTAR